MLDPQQSLMRKPQPKPEEDELTSASTADTKPEELSTAQSAVPLALLRLREAQQRRRQIAAAAS
jgi:hypothetical protein